MNDISLLTFVPPGVSESLSSGHVRLFGSKTFYKLAFSAENLPKLTSISLRGLQKLTFSSGAP
jgi:hypothetical protein